MKRASNDSGSGSTTTITTNKYYNMSKSIEPSSSSKSNGLVSKYSIFSESNNTSTSTRPNKLQKTKKKTSTTTTAPTTLSKYYNYNLYLEKQQSSSTSTNNKTTLTTTTTLTTKQTTQPKTDSQKTTNYNLPLIIQKEIIFLLVEIGGFKEGRGVSKYWKKVCHGCMDSLNIYFTDIQFSASVKHVSDVFLKSIVNEYLSLNSVSFINGSKTSISYSEFYFNSVILPFIENLARYNKTITIFTIKGFPISRINNKSSQQLSPSYKLYHSSSTASPPLTPPQQNNNNSNSIITTTPPSTTPSTPITPTIPNISKGLYFYLTNGCYLKSISLKNIGLDSRDKFDFFTSLSTINNTLEEFTICDNIGDEGMQLLSVILVKNLLTNLKKLSLQKNQFTNQSAYYLNRVLLSPDSKIEYINLSKNRIDEHGLQIMKEGFNGNKQLKTLILSRNKFSNTDFFDFGSSITTLDLHDSLVANSKLAIKGLALYLASNDSIVNLNLSFNHIGSADAIKTLSKSLAVNQTIRNLDLSFNKINASFGLDHLVSSLLKNSIESISLQSNHLDNSSAIILSQLFDSSKYKNINLLNLSGNKIGVGGFKKLVSNLSKYSKTHLIYNDNAGKPVGQESSSLSSSSSSTAVAIILPSSKNRSKHSIGFLNNMLDGIDSNSKLVKNYSDDIDIYPIPQQQTTIINEDDVDRVLNNIDNEISLEQSNNNNNAANNNDNNILIDLSLNCSLDVSKVISGSLLPKLKNLKGSDKSLKKYDLVQLKF